MPPDPADAERTRLARRQRDLLRVLQGGSTPPPGFAPCHVERAQRSLLAKRRRTVAKLLPHLCASLGPAFRPAFDAYASTHPTPASPTEDADAFRRHMMEKPAPHLWDRLRRAVARAFHQRVP